MKKIHLNIRFSDFTEFDVSATVVRSVPGDTHLYGVKFDHVNNDLADHLLNTQRRLKFK
ncbi:MAG: PilZ domain-containing protein [Gammaproteobacteria bacterium]|nr:PilZ domain-containing protein [Gammaproteobacteria bacterium]